MNPREWAIYKEVWTLTGDERAKLDRFFLKFSTASALYQNISDEHEWKDTLENSGITYNVIYLNCCLARLEDLGSKLILVSFRCNYQAKLAFALIWNPSTLTDLQIKAQATELEF